MGSAALTLADLPNIMIMIAALIALFIVLVIFLRNMEFIGIVGEGARSEPWRTMPPPQLLMQRVHIPFTFKLDEDKPVSYDQIHCTVSSTVRYWHASWWGAPVRELHATLWGSLAEILASRRFVRSDPHTELPTRLACESPPPLGAPPRACYPLVVILARDPQHVAGNTSPHDTVALVSVIHIQDEQCPLPSGIIAQYLKQANGHLSCLKRLYLSCDGADSATYDAEPRAGAAPAPVAAAPCCVCAARPLSRALLPCRHACLCEDCLPKLDKCPICRSVITSYFCMHDEGRLSEMKRQRFALNRRLFNLFHYH